LILEQLKQLDVSFAEYFPQNTIENEWMTRPFSVTVETLPEDLSGLEQEKLLSLSFDEFWKSKFKIMSLEEFWMAISDAYPLLYAKAFKMFFPFSTSYLCEQGFSQMLYIKNKYRSKLDLEQILE
jgi:zinc finger BED domain-containing protein 5/7/8/9